MEIEAKNLKEAFVYRIPLIAEDERFYFIPGASAYAFSTYARLYKKESEKKWVRQEMMYRNTDSYKVLYDYVDEEKIVSVETLIKQVFFPDKNIFKIYNPSSNPKDPKKWDIKNLYTLSKSEYIYVLQCKMNCKKPNLEGLQPILTMLYGLPMRSKINSMYDGMKTRACNWKYKKIHPLYYNTVMDDDWKKNPIHAKEYIISRLYYYPEKLVMDKDIMTYGLGDYYAPECAVPLPYKYNNVFCKGTSKLGYCIKKEIKDDGKECFVIPGSMLKGTKDIVCQTYKEALEIARKKKAEYVRAMAQEEREKGFMPEYIILQMDKWADKCEKGELIAWEPDAKTLEEMGVHYDYSY